MTDNFYDIPGSYQTVRAQHTETSEAPHGAAYSPLRASVVGMALLAISALTVSNDLTSAGWMPAEYHQGDSEEERVYTFDAQQSASFAEATERSRPSERLRAALGDA